MTPSQLDRSQIILRDPGQVGASLDFLADQISDGWRQARSVRLPKTYRQVNRVAVCGMGGSNLPADIVCSALGDTLPVPVTIVADYNLPAWVNRQTLVICSSYSGSTEESVAAMKEARRRGAKIVAMTTGGQLLKLAQLWNVPVYHFFPSANPSGQPRLGVGYGLTALLACFRSMGWVSVPNSDIKAMVAEAEAAKREYGTSRSAKRNIAKQLALSCADRIPMLIGAEWTSGNVHAWANQINENAKTFSARFSIPDLNHHLLEGMRNKKMTRQFYAVFIHDKTYHQRNQKRMLLTEKILKDQGATTSRFTPLGKTKLARAVHLLAFGGYVSWYMAAARNIKPAPIPTVDWLKAQLAK